MCQSITCASDFRFRCDNFKCIPRWRLCDKVDNCGDGSDENNFELCEAEASRTGSCDATQFKCANRRCVEMTQICDDVDDCGDQSDELGCQRKGNCPFKLCLIQ